VCKQTMALITLFPLICNEAYFTILIIYVFLSSLLSLLSMFADLLSLFYLTQTGQSGQSIFTCINKLV